MNGGLVLAGLLLVVLRHNEIGKPLSPDRVAEEIP